MQYANIFKHLKTITEHKLAVMELCFRVGLIKQGLLHDLSKYSPEEFITGIYFYQGTRSPNAAEKMVRGYSVAWLHHKGRNKHHFEYWIDYAIDPTEGLVGMKMPLRCLKATIECRALTVVTTELDCMHMFSILTMQIFNDVPTLVLRAIIDKNNLISEAISFHDTLNPSV